MTVPESGWYFVDREGKKQGPKDSSSLLAIHANGGLDDSSLVWVQGFDEWKRFHVAFKHMLPPPIPKAEHERSQIGEATTLGIRSPAHVGDYKRQDETNKIEHNPENVTPSDKGKSFPPMFPTPIRGERDPETFIKAYAVAAHILSLAFAGTLLEMFSRASAPTLRGVAGWLAAGTGLIVIALLVGLLGLLNKNARFPTFVAISWAVFFLIVKGAWPQ